MATGGELTQLDSNTLLRITEKNCPVHEQELLAMKCCLRKWRHYPENQPETVILTDHRSLEHVLKG